MPNLKMFEIFEQFETVHENSRARFLNYNNSKTLRDILFFTFHPDVRFYRTEAPAGYKPNITDPIGLAPTNLHDEMRKSYIFVLGHPKSNGISFNRRDELLMQFLEALEAKEAQVYLNMMAKDLKIKNLTIDVVKEAFPQLLG